MILINKENKFQSLLAAVELNRTGHAESRRQGTAGPVHPLTKDHYQSHREFGRDLSNNGSNNNSH